MPATSPAAYKPGIISPSVLITLAFSSIFKPPKVKQFEQIIGHARKGGEEIGLDQLDLFIDSPSVLKPSGASGSKLVLFRDKRH